MRIEFFFFLFSLGLAKLINEIIRIENEQRKIQGWLKGAWGSSKRREMLNYHYLFT